MISLRGPVRQKEGGQWEWTGVWAFGTLPDDKSQSHAATDPSKGSRGQKSRSNRRTANRKGPAARPFRYTFHEAIEASKVSIPWYNTAASELEGTSKDEEHGESFTTPSSQGDEATPPARAASKLVNTVTASPGPPKFTRTDSMQTGCPSPRSTAMQQSESESHKRVVSSTESSPSSSPVRRQESDVLCPQSHPRVEGEDELRRLSTATSTPVPSLNAETEGGGEESSVVTNSSSQDDSELPDHDSKKIIEMSISSPTLSARSGDKTGRKDESQMAGTTGIDTTVQCPQNDNNNPSQGSPPDEADGLRTNEQMENSEIECERLISNSAIEVAKDELEEDSTSRHSNASGIFREKKSESEKELKSSEPVTFATVTEFRDAGVDNPGKCPVGGTWKGYFENVQTRKDRKTSRVAETFYLYFNSVRPESDDKVEFSFSLLDEEGSRHAGVFQKSDDGAEIFHLRGMGNNQFGTFELVGKFNVSSGVLHCYRVYVQFPGSSSAETTKQSRTTATPSKSREVRRSSRQSDSSYSRPYFTRKRQMSWRRRDCYGDDDDDEEERLRRQRANNRKRKDATSHSSLLPCSDGLSGDSAQVKRTESTGTSSVRKKSGALSLSIKLPGTMSELKSGEGERLSPVSKKSKADSDSRSNVASAVIVLPTVPDPSTSRWRSAHIFYRTKIPSESCAPGSGAMTSSSSAAEHYSQCIYEGEVDFRKGHTQREGRGTCLYENGNIYEGFWRRNKEHGRGVLMTGNRRDVIYEGDWERGRMHGSGIYYYSLDQNYDNNFNAQQLDEDLGDFGPKPSRKDRGGGIYKGDFKENCRHGFGVYTLPNGCVYDGEWRDNVQCGRGQFRWTDGSSYEGQWKNGKRNGIGTLRAADGFVYEGQWVANAMEGRGSCIYPNGQQYEGLWCKGKKEGRGTIRFSNGAVYEGRFRDDRIEGQGTMKINANVPLQPEGKMVKESDNDFNDKASDEREDVVKAKVDWMIPIQFQSDMSYVHQRAGFTQGGS